MENNRPKEKEEKAAENNEKLSNEKLFNIYFHLVPLISNYSSTSSAIALFTLPGSLACFFHSRFAFFIIRVEETNRKNYYSFIKFLTPERFGVFNLLAIFLVLKRNSGKVWGGEENFENC